MNSDNIRPKAVGPDEVAQALSLIHPDGRPNRELVLKLARQGKIPCVRFSNKVIRFYLDEVEAATRSSK
jgi:hypothetical protein